MLMYPDTLIKKCFITFSTTDTETQFHQFYVRKRSRYVSWNFYIPYSFGVLFSLNHRDHLVWRVINVGTHRTNLDPTGILNEIGPLTYCDTSRNSSDRPRWNRENLRSVVHSLCCWTSDETPLLWGRRGNFSWLRDRLFWSTKKVDVGDVWQGDILTPVT